MFVPLHYHLRSVASSKMSTKIVGQQTPHFGGRTSSHKLTTMRVAFRIFVLLCITQACIGTTTYEVGSFRRNRHRHHHLKRKSDVFEKEMLSASTSLAKGTSIVNTVPLQTKPGSSDALDAIYSPWSDWSPCLRKCKQERSRQCKDPWRCGNAVMKEERSCKGRRCRRRPFTVVDVNSSKTTTTTTTTTTMSSTMLSDSPSPSPSPPQHRGLGHAGMKNFLYSQWSEWSPCTRNCRTRRYRTCKMALMCGTSVIQEDAFCYVRGTVCERMFRRLKKNVTDKLKEPQETSPSLEMATKSPTVEECGVSNVTADMSLRIIGGQSATKGRWPWQVAILNRFKEAFCGGTLVASQWVVTAAHCIRKRLFVRVGEHDLSANEGTEQDYRVMSIHVHPDYDPETVDNDIALLKLSSPAEINRHVQFACLPKHNVALPRDRHCTILGWGKEKDVAIFGTDVLNEAKVPIVNISNCLDVYKDYYITENMFCAGYRRGRVDSCAGDSGGPLLCEVDNRWHVYGVTSFGEGCGRKGKYGIYVKVPNYVTWMETTMQENSDIL